MKKELLKSMMTIECPDCYLLGFKKELKKKDAEMQEKLDKNVEECIKQLDDKTILDTFGLMKVSEIKKAIDEIPCYPFRNQNTGEVEPFISRGELKQKLGVK